MSKKKERGWGPDKNGRWGNNMMSLRDGSADDLIAIHRRLSHLLESVNQGQDTRLEKVMALSESLMMAQRALMKLQQAGAPVDLDALERR